MPQMRKFTVADPHKIPSTKNVITKNKGTHSLLWPLSLSNNLTACGVKHSLVLAPVLETIAQMEAVWFTRASRSLNGFI